MENNRYINFFFNTICGLLINGTRRTLPWRRETKRRKKDDDHNDEIKMSLLDLPDVVLDIILDKLSASELCAMTFVCSELRDKCVRDYLWEKHMEKKWGRLMGAAATQEWKNHVSSMLMGRPSCGKRRRSSSSSTVPIDSLMYWYSNLESGKFWFPAQVKERNPVFAGHGMSCYDAEVRYDYKTDTFQARNCWAHGLLVAAKVNLPWQRLRPSLTDKESRILYMSDSLQGLRPLDCFEIQWRKTKELPYVWRFGYVYHLQNCYQEENCRCLSHENVVLMFNPCRRELPWGMMVVNRENYREWGNEATGFYGGVRKIG